MPSLSDIQAARAYVEVKLRDVDVREGLQRLEADLKRTAVAAAQLGSRLMAFGSAALGPLLLAAKKFTDFGDATAKTARRLQISTEALTAFRYAAEAMGAQASNLDEALRIMTRRVGEFQSGTGEAARAFQALGIAAEDLAGLSTAEQFELIRSRLAEVADHSRRAALAAKIFDTNWAPLAPLLGLTNEEFRNLVERARALGITLSQEDAAAAEELSDLFNELSSTVRQLVVQVGSALAPALKEVLQWLRANVEGAARWVREHGAAIVMAAKVAAVVVSVGAALMGLVSALGLATTAVKALSAAVTLFLAHPLVAVLTATAAAVLYLTGAFDRLGEAIEGVIAGGSILDGWLGNLTDRMAKLRSESQQARGEWRKLLRDIQELSVLEQNEALTPEEARRDKEIAERLKQSSIGELIRGPVTSEKAREALRSAMRIRLESEANQIQMQMDELKRLAFNAAREGDLAAARRANQEMERLKEQLVEVTRQQQLVSQGRLEEVLRLRGIDPLAEAQRRRQRQFEQQAAELNRLAEQRRRQQRREEMTPLERRIDEIREQFQRERQAVQRLLEIERSRPGGGRRNVIEELERRLDRLDREEELRVQRAEQKAFREGPGRFLEEINAEIERLQIEAAKEGLDRELALLELDRKKALQKAKEMGIGQEEVNRKFDLLRRLAVKRHEAAQEAADGESVVGLFNAFALRALGARSRDPVERLAEEARQQNRKLARLIDVAERRGVFV